MARSPSRSSTGSAENQNVRAEPRILKCIEEGKNDEAVAVIEAAKAKGQPIDHLLRIGLMRAAERGNITATEKLLKLGAKPDGAPGGRLSPLLRAVEKNHVGVVQLLLKYKGDVNVADKQGRTALMTAAWKNYWHILQELIRNGADVNKKDYTGRNVLHNLAADKHNNWGKDIIDVLLLTSVAIDGPEAEDDLKRTPLHWACATGKKDLAEWLLTRPRLPRANVNAVDGREKTSLHLAASHGRDDIVELLLRYGADVNAKSDGSWTPLHNACENGNEKSVRLLLGAGAQLNGRVLNGMTPLHIAAQKGHMDVVKCLLERKDIKRAARDSSGITPFLLAAQNKRKDIVNVLAPSNHVESLSEDALGACNGFNATIVDFGNFRNENKVRRKTVYELLYGRDPINPRKPAVSILPTDSKATSFRWIHLPANNMAWVEALLTKAFIEEGASDVEGFKALERSFNHQHRGHLIHSHFMRPLCQSTPRAPKFGDESDYSGNETEPGPPQIVINGEAAAGLAITEGPEPAPHSPARSATKGSDKDDWSKGSGRDSGKEQAKGKGKEKKQNKYGKNAKPYDTPTKGSQKPQPRRRPSTPVHQGHLRSPGSPGRKDPTQTARGNIFAFMPYLHFETDRSRKEMQAAISRAQTMKSTNEPHLGLQRAKTYDEMLLRAHLTTSSVSLHVRRTLDQFFYHNIDTQSRDQDQVVYRYQCKGRPAEESGVDPKIFMVDQLWMWILGKDLIVTSFPQRWQQPKNDPLNVLNGIIEVINSKTREHVRTVYDLAMIITGRCSGVFDRHRMGDEDYQFLDMFESSIGDATDRETLLFKEFNTASLQASVWLLHHRRPNRFSRHLEAESRNLEHSNRHHASHLHPENLTESQLKEERFRYEDSNSIHAPLFVDKLLDIGSETGLLAETKDIRDELNMISKVLEDQKTVLPDLEAAIIDIYREEHKSQQEVKKRFKEQLKMIEMHQKDIDRMDKQAERIYSSITDLLDLKQKHANAFEARFARDQAAGTARQSQTIMVFTIVTIIFLPLSFIAAIFTINVREFPHVGENVSLPFSFVSKIMFGVSFAISIPLILIAVSVDAIADYIREIKRRWREYFYKRKQRRSNSGSGTLAGTAATAGSIEKFDAGSMWLGNGSVEPINMDRIERNLSAGRSTRGRPSHDTEHLGSPLLPITSRGTGRSARGPPGIVSAAANNMPTPTRVPTGFRIRRSLEV
jgi:ankyrin repeat protein/Mg2+ and Co2+ transporter CorA